jgi:hypothetical protein
MKRKIILSIALILSVILVSMISSDSTALAQQPQRFTADTGMVTLGPNQVLRVTVATGDINGEDSVNVRLRWIEYTQGVCNSGGVCKHAIESQNTSAPITLAPGEVVSFDHIGNFNFLRAVVLGNRRKLRVNMIVFDTSTQRVVAMLCNNEVIEE